MNKQEILDRLPFAHPYRFVDELLEVDEEQLTATYTFKQDEFFYEGHFPSRPVTPGAILAETAAQAVLALGIYLVREDESAFQKVIFLTSSELRFKRIVFPGDRVLVYVEKMYFRFNKLKCKVKMTTLTGETICRGNISGILINEDEQR